MNTELKHILNHESYRAYNEVELMNPVGSGFVFIAGEVDAGLPFLAPSRARRALISDCKRACRRFTRRTEVRSAITFRAFLAPPGKGAYLEHRPDIHVPKYDVAVLIETDDIQSAQRLRTDQTFLMLEIRFRVATEHTYVVTGRNVRRMGPVDHGHQGVFFFNYFVAEDVEQNLAVWNYTAGWFAQETGLDNSTVLQPLSGQNSEYSIVNHCRWDRLRDVLPSILFKPSFHDYVKANFEANHVAPIPIFYRKA